MEENRSINSRRISAFIESGVLNPEGLKEAVKALRWYATHGAFVGYARKALTALGIEEGG